MFTSRKHWKCIEHFQVISEVWLWFECGDWQVFKVKRAICLGYTKVLTHMRPTNAQRKAHALFVKPDVKSQVLLFPVLKLVGKCVSTFQTHSPRKSPN